MSRSLRTYVAATAVVAIGCLWAAGWRASAPDAAPHWNALAAFMVLGFLSEASYLKLRVGRTETQSSIAFIPYIASFLLFDTGWSALVAAASMAGVDFAVRKKDSTRIVFNASQMIISIALASWVYQSLGGKFTIVRELFLLSPAPVVLGATTYFFVNSTLVSGFVALATNVPLRTSWLRIAGSSLAYDLFSSPLGPLLAYLYARFEVPGILILILPLYFVRHIYQVNLQLEQVNRDLLELMVKAIEARDPYTSGHSLRVSQTAGQIAREIGLGHKLVDQITTAALLHDVGKIYEEYAPLLRKESKLDPTEKALLQTHPARSAELVATISAFRGVIEESVRHHHENFDGTGYPSGASGRDIPIGARIIMIADTMDAMSTDRPYRKALTFDRVIDELGRYSGRQFDPELVEHVVNSSAVGAMVTARVNAQRQGELVEADPMMRGVSRSLLVERAITVRQPH